jgi:hypothetical protein
LLRRQIQLKRRNFFVPIGVDQSKMAIFEFKRKNGGNN